MENKKEKEGGCPAQPCPNGWVWDYVQCCCVEDIGARRDEEPTEKPAE